VKKQRCDLTPLMAIERYLCTVIRQKATRPRCESEKISLCDLTQCEYLLEERRGVERYFALEAAPNPPKDEPKEVFTQNGIKQSTIAM
jgi:hypothetical protein